MKKPKNKSITNEVRGFIRNHMYDCLTMDISDLVWYPVQYPVKTVLRTDVEHVVSNSIEISLALPILNITGIKLKQL